jgi:hypothetical protein
LVDASSEEGADRALLYVPATGEEHLSVDSPFGRLAAITVSRSWIEGSSKTGGIWVAYERSSPRYRIGDQGIGVQVGAASKTMLRINCASICDQCPDGAIKVRVQAGSFHERRDMWREFEYASLAECRAVSESGGEEIELPSWPQGDYWATTYILAGLEPNKAAKMSFELKPIAFQLD